MSRGREDDNKRRGKIRRERNGALKRGEEDSDEEERERERAALFNTVTGGSCLAGGTFGIWITKQDSQYSPFSPRGKTGAANPAAHCSLQKYDNHTVLHTRTHTLLSLNVPSSLEFPSHPDVLAQLKIFPAYSCFNISSNEATEQNGKMVFVVF